MAKTVEQIATALNLSITTVRLVLNGKAERYRISAKTQEKIASYVKHHGYTVNYIARSLKLNKTDTFGLVLPRLSNPFFAALVEKLETRCRDAGYQLMTSCSYGDEQYENKLVEALAQRNTDGIFIVSSSADCQKYQLKNINKPLVFFDRDFSVEGASCAVSNNSQSGYALANAMLSHAKQPIYFFASDIALPTIAARLEGYLKANGEHGYHDVGDKIIAYAQHNKIEDGVLMMSNYIQQYDAPPSAFIASSLPILEGALSVLRERYGRIPSGLNIGTFDEHAMLGFLANPIWSIRQDVDSLVDAAFSIMQNKLNGSESVERFVAQTELVCRMPG
jgi:D-fructose-responsive transcription factor